MPSMSNIILRKDDATDVLYVPVSDTPFPHWRTNFSGVPMHGQARLEVKTETMKNGNVRVNIKLAQPIMEIIPSGSVGASGIQAAPAVADEEVISMTFYASQRGSNETRADLLRQFAHLIAGAGATSGSIVAPPSATADTYRDVAVGIPVIYGIVNLLWPS